MNYQNKTKEELIIDLKKLQQEFNSLKSSYHKNITEFKREEETLLESKKRFQKSEEVAHLGSWEMELATGKSKWSDEFFRICGIEPGSFEPTSEDGFKIIHHEDRGKVKHAVENSIKNGIPYNIEKRIVRPDKTIRWVQSVGEVILDDKNKPYKLIGSLLDITENKLAKDALRESDERFRTIFENSPIGIDIVTAEGNPVQSNQKLNKMLGYSEEELQQMVFADYTHPYDVAESLRLTREVREGTRERFTMEKRYISKKGEEKWGYVAVSGVKDIQGKFLYFIAMVEDITERKQIGQKLLESENLLDSTQKITKVGGWRWNVKTQEMFWTAETYHIHEIDPNEIEPGSQEHIERSIKCYDEKDRQIILEAFHKCANPGEPYDMEFPFTSEKGNRIWVRTTAKPEKVNNKVVRVVGNIIDITNYKNVLKALESSEERLKVIFELAPDAVYLFDFKGNFLDGNKAAEEMIGYKKEELIGKNFFKLKLLPAADLASIAKVLIQVATGKKTGIIEYSIKHKNGNLIPIEVSAYPVKISGKTVILGIARNITERKKSGKELLESEKKYKALYNDAPLPYQSLNTEGNFLEVNPAWLKTLGYKKEEIIGNNFGDFMTEESAKLVASQLSAFKKSGIIKDVEFDMISKKGLIVKGRFNGTIVFDKSGKFKQTHCIFEDITERKKIENKLIQKEAKIQSIFRSAPVGIGVVNNRVIKQVNNQFCEMLGYAEKELIGQNSVMVYPSKEEYKKVGINKYEQIAKLGSGAVETQLKRKDGKIIDVILSSTQIEENDANGDVVFTTLDITESKKAGQELAESEIKFRLLADYTFDWEYWVDANGDYIYISPSCYRITGYKSEEFKSNPDILYEIVRADYLEKVRTHYHDENNRDTPIFSIEFPIIAKNGEEIWLEHNCSPVFADDGKYLGRRGNNRDITWRKKSEEALIKSEEFKEKLIASSYDCIKTIDLSGNLLSMSAGGQKLLEIDDVGSVLNNSWIEFWKGEDNERAVEAVVKAGQGMIGRFQGFCPTQKGTPKNWDIIISPIRNIDGKIDQLLAISRDITEEKQIADKLHESEERYRTLFDNNPVDTIVVDKRGKIIAFNDAKKREGGRIPAIGKELYAEYAGQHKINMRTELIECIKTAKSKKFPELEYGDNRKFLSITIAPFNQGAIIASEDITVRKQAEQIQKVLYNISKAVSTTDNIAKLIAYIKIQLGTIINTTNFYVALDDLKNGELSLPFISDEFENPKFIPAGKTLTRYVVDSKKPLLANIDEKRRMVKEGKIDHFGVLSKVWLGIPLKVEGEVIGVLAVQSYTSEDAYNEKDLKMLEFVSNQISLSIHRKKTEENLIQALQKATESERLKSAFLANMSHEIRTPMNGILGFADLLKEPNLTGTQQKEYIDIIKKSGDRMLNTINDIVDFSRIEAGQMTVSNTSVNLFEHLNFQYLFFKPEADKKGINFSIKNDKSSTKIVVNTDREKLHAILSNLIKNAIKYTQKGSIEFGYEIIKTKSGSFLQFYVKDTGMGIPKDRQKAVFDRFVQADIEDKLALQGSGLGLSISKAFVEMLGGKISVESELSVGSIFYFTIPYREFDKIKKQVVKEVEKTSKLEKKLILIVDDDELSFTLLEVVLEKLGLDIIWAKNGKKAIEYCAKNKRIDLVLMDINMPLMNGYEATKKIKKLRPTLPVIAQTAFALVGDQEKSIAAGCDDYISKPIKSVELIELIKRQFI